MQKKKFFTRKTELGFRFGSVQKNFHRPVGHLEVTKVTRKLLSEAVPTIERI